MNELIDSFRLYAGIARVHNSAQLVVIDEHGNIIDPLIGLEMFAELIIHECIEIVLSSDPSPKMSVREPYGSIMENIKEHFGV